MVMQLGKDGRIHPPIHMANAFQQMLIIWLIIIYSSSAVLILNPLKV